MPFPITIRPWVVFHQPADIGLAVDDDLLSIDQPLFVEPVPGDIELNRPACHQKTIHRDPLQLMTRDRVTQATVRLDSWMDAAKSLDGIAPHIF